MSLTTLDLQDCKLKVSCQSVSVEGVSMVEFSILKKNLRSEWLEGNVSDTTLREQAAPMS